MLNKPSAIVIGLVCGVFSWAGKAVTFSKVVTPWLPLRRPESMVTPGPVRALPVACLSTLLPADSSSG